MTTNANRMNLRLVAAAGIAVAAMAPTVLAQSNGDSTDRYANLPATLTLTGVVRDFQERSITNGHPDFELNPSGGFGHFQGIVKDELDAEGKPVFNSAGYKTNTNWKDASGRNVMKPRSYMSALRGDVNGALATTTGGQATSGDRLAQWFRDVPGVNMSKNLDITLVRQTNSNVYTFNDKTDSTFKSLGGFFPINGQLYGNSKNETKNFHFSFELVTEFVYKKGSGQVFTFTGDDDVWVFVDNKLVIDIGGIHSAVSQTIELDRLNWLEDGGTYKLNFFFAERHRTQSNCRIDTTMQLRTVDPPATTAIFD
ncbi:MAG: fibro-slime domain-containing protein [Phycisphaerales bacterium]|jgi:fibro-slime domain-containing protein|nr:fibro-slime domain-containing protein [Phycisphaerales bacterium]